MNLKVLYILFWLYSILGFLMETTVVSIKNKRIVNRGFLLGPYCPIYGTGSILLLSIKSYQTEPLVVFILAIVICSLVEYITSYIMELIFRVRWWDYSNRFLNINGRICLANTICFGLLGMLIVCFLNPFFINYISNMNYIILNIITIILFITTTIDIVLTTITMFDIRNIIINFKDRTVNLFHKNQDSTEEISMRIRSILKEKSFLHKHLSKSYSNFKVYKNNFLKKKEELIKYKRITKIENIVIITSFISIIIGFILGKLFNQIGLCISSCFTLNIIINKIIRSRNDK